MLLLRKDIKIPHHKIGKIDRDAELSAEAVNLKYVCDSEPGIIRKRKGKTFVYFLGNKKVTNESTLWRIKSLVIPPAWKNVWICAAENGHLQVTGLDIKKRKQYKYHHLWNKLRNHTKFHRLHSFGKSIPQIRQQIESDLSLSGLPLEKVLAAVVCLMERTSIRIGNNLYEKLYGSFGLTTLKDQHVKIKGAQLQFIFKGKKGVSHNISIKSKRLANIVQKCRDIPGKELFQYIDEDGEYRCIDSGMVNDYVKRISGEDFSAKDFRTWTGSVQALMAFKELGADEENNGNKKNIVLVLDKVAKHLGNTRTVCKKYYVHPVIISLYENKALDKYLKGGDKENKNEKHALGLEEKILMKILRKEAAAFTA